MEVWPVWMNLLIGFGNFLYFPEDKSEYIPAAISMSVFVLMAIGAFLLIKRISRKEEERTKHLEEQIQRANKTKR
jgi:flagellar biosynthesis/type III secretory pathway M-ring protein FliF/YscJ